MIGVIFPPRNKKGSPKQIECDDIDIDMDRSKKSNGVRRLNMDKKPKNGKKAKGGSRKLDVTNNKRPHPRQAGSNESSKKFL